MNWAFGTQSQMVRWPLMKFLTQKGISVDIISFVFAVTLQSDPPQSKKANTEPHLPGQWRWFHSCPENFIKNQRVLKKYINNEY